MSTHPIKTPSADGARQLPRARELCMSLPEVTEQLAWGAPTWRIGGRVFAQWADHHHGNPHVALWLAAPQGAQPALIEAEPTRFFRPAYVGHLGWVAAVLDDDGPWDMIAAVIEQAYREIASRGPARRRAAAPATKAVSPRAAKPRAAKPRAATPRAAKPRAAKPRAAKPRAAKPRAASAAKPRAASAAKPRAASSAKPRAASSAKPRAASTAKPRTAGRRTGA